MKMKGEGRMKRKELEFRGLGQNFVYLTEFKTSFLVAFPTCEP